MLKIKDDVDLKELEKYGFTGHLRKGCSGYYIKRVYDTEIILAIANRIIHMQAKDEDAVVMGRADDESLDVLFDLIQAGIVEKAGE